MAPLLVTNLSWLPEVTLNNHVLNIMKCLVQLLNLPLLEFYLIWSCLMVVFCVKLIVTMHFYTVTFLRWCLWLNYFEKYDNSYNLLACKLQK